MDVLKPCRLRRTGYERGGKVECSRFGTARSDKIVGLVWSRVVYMMATIRSSSPRVF